MVAFTNPPTSTMAECTLCRYTAGSLQVLPKGQSKCQMAVLATHIQVETKRELQCGGHMTSGCRDTKATLSCEWAHGNDTAHVLYRWKADLCQRRTCCCASSM
eukprot:jgi/Ulvmu1/11778/UM008_0192.1